MNRKIITGIFALPAIFVFAATFAVDVTAQDTVQLFDEANFENKVADLGPGYYDSDEGSFPVELKNDHVLKSIRVPLGMGVIFYEHANRRGAAHVYSFDDVANMTHEHASQVSSFDVVNTFPTVEEIQKLEGQSWTGDFHWVHDDEHGASTLTLLADGKIRYNYANGLLNEEFDAKVIHGGGDSANAPMAGITLADGNEVRFEWVTHDVVKCEFWIKGARAGQKRNNPPTTRATLVRKK